MNINLDRMNTPAPIPLAEEIPVGNAEAEAPRGLQVSEAGASGAAAIPGEESVDEAALRRDDDLGQLVDRVFNDKSAKRVVADIGFEPDISAGEQVAKNIGDSADELKALFERNKEIAKVKRDRLEAVLAAEAAKASTDQERLDALAREIGLQV